MKGIICDQCGKPYAKNNENAWNLRDRDTMGRYDLCSPSCLYAKMSHITGDSIIVTPSTTPRSPNAYAEARLNASQDARIIDF